MAVLKGELWLTWGNLREKNLRRVGFADGKNTLWAER